MPDAPSALTLDTKDADATTAFRPSPSGPKPRWSRVVLKLSGEAFADPLGAPIDGDIVARIASEIIDVQSELKVQLAIVVGGGNIWRGQTGAAAEGIDRTTSDYMGMLGTVINALALQDALERQGQPTRTQTAIQMSQIAEPYIRRRAMRHLEKGRVVIFACGNGNPYFTTDTTAALRAAEIEAEAILKGTHTTDGVYDADPRTNPQAKRYEQVGYAEVLSKNLRVMDLTAISFCMDNNLPIVVFHMMQKGNIRAVLLGDPPIGTLVS